MEREIKRKKGQSEQQGTFREILELERRRERRSALWPRVSYRQSYTAGLSTEQMSR